MSSLAAIVLTAYLASARSDTAVGLELPVITAVVLGGINIFGGAGTMIGVLIALLVLAFVQNALGLAGVTPEEQQIVTGAVLILTLIVFGVSDIIKKTRETLSRYRATRSSSELRGTPLKAFEHQHGGALVFGNGRIGEVGTIVSRYGRRCLIVSGSIRGALRYLYPIVGELLEHVGLEWEQFDGVVPNPEKI
jgi:hypothetical protein